MNERLGTRTYSIWLSQLLLAVVVVVVVLLVQALDPATLSFWTFTIGVSAIVVLTAIALVAPWPRLPGPLVLTIPMLDIVAVGIMTVDTDINLGFLWVFPITWIATHFGLLATSGSLALVGVIVILEESFRSDNDEGSLRLIIVMLSLTFIAISALTVARQTRAFKRLLRRQALKLNDALTRTTRQERQVSQVLDSIDVGVVRLAADGSILDANNTYRQLYSINESDARLHPGSVEYQEFKGEALSHDDRPLARAQSGEHFTDVRTWLFDKTGSWRALSLSVRLLPEDAVAGSGRSLLIAHDITAMSRAERAREGITRRVSHELRNPLTTIIGFSDLVLDTVDVDPKVYDRVTAISAAAERMMTLSGEILETGKDTQSAEAAVVRVDLARVANDSVESFMPTAAASGVRLQLEGLADSKPAGHDLTSDGVPATVTNSAHLMGDAFRLRQVADNLLSNAVKYTPKGGTVTVRVGTEGTKTVLSVNDTGMGMQPEEVERIYEPYFRTEAARASAIVGTGLGMQIVHSLVTEHRGTLDIESTPGAGTTVTVRFSSDCGRAASDSPDDYAGAPSPLSESRPTDG